MDMTTVNLPNLKAIFSLQRILGVRPAMLFFVCLVLQTTAVFGFKQNWQSKLFFLCFLSFRLPSHRRRSWHILGGVKDFCPILPKLSRKNTQKKHLLVILGAILKNQSSSSAIFSRIFRDFSKVFTDFAQISTKSKLLGCACTQPPTPLFPVVLLCQIPLWHFATAPS